MNTRMMTIAMAALITGTLVAAQPPEMPGPQKEHEWLKQFVGEWDTEADSIAMPGQPATKCKGTMSSRMLGGFWVISDIKGDMAGTPMHGISTIGYDPHSKKYIGTWIDSMMNHMWKYQGTVDSTGKILTLEAEGPNMAKPGAIAKYRDIYEFKSKDQIAMSSQMLGDDGKWTLFMSSNIHRKKK